MKYVEYSSNIKLVSISSKISLLVNTISRLIAKATCHHIFCDYTDFPVIRQGKEGERYRYRNDGRIGWGERWAVVDGFGSDDNVGQV